MLRIWGLEAEAEAEALGYMHMLLRRGLVGGRWEFWGLSWGEGMYTVQ